MCISAIAIICESGTSAEGLRNSPGMSGVSQILGKQDFSDYGREAPAAGIWSVQP